MREEKFVTVSVIRQDVVVRNVADPSVWGSLTDSELFKVLDAQSLDAKILLDVGLCSIPPFLTLTRDDFPITTKILIYVENRLPIKSKLFKLLKKFKFVPNLLQKMDFVFEANRNGDVEKEK